MFIQIFSTLEIVFIYQKSYFSLYKVITDYLNKATQPLRTRVTKTYVKFPSGICSEKLNVLSVWCVRTSGCSKYEQRY